MNPIIDFVSLVNILISSSVKVLLMFFDAIVKLGFPLNIVVLLLIFGVPVVKKAR